MENKNVGYILIGVAILLIVIVLLFQSALKNVVASTCTADEHSISCPMNEGINQQTYLSLGIVGLLMIIGFRIITTNTFSRNYSSLERLWKIWFR